MAMQKLYAGAKLRELRRRLGHTQKDFARTLGLSLSYLNQMENNHRPVSAGVVLALAREYALDVTELSVGEGDRMVADMREALSDPLFDDPPALADLQLTAANAPRLARAFLTLHRAHRQTQDRLALLDQALGQDNTASGQQPWEEVRDFFHYCDNYIDAVDHAGEHFATQAGLGRGDTARALGDWLHVRHNIRIQRGPDAPHRALDRAKGVLSLSSHSSMATQAFQISHQIALLDHDKLLNATLDLARFHSDQARAIAKIGLANYFAGAALMPYGAFLAAAQSTRHDLEQLSEMFGVSLEQVAHRLSTLQRPGAKGVPFFFVRVDQAGTITKRHSAARLQFARFGGACPLWNVHRAFETPAQFQRQLAETPDGVRYFCLARDISKSGGSFRAPMRRYAIALGCEVDFAAQLVYADDLDLSNSAAFEPIGVSCRICPRKTCHQRAVPPLQAVLGVDHDRHDGMPYVIL